MTPMPVAPETLLTRMSLAQLAELIIAWNDNAPASQSDESTTGTDTQTIIPSKEH